MPSAQPPLVSIITVNYNQLELTCEMLDSVKRQSYRNYEVILVDNASQPSAIRQRIARDYPEVRLIMSDTNLGFAGGNNLALPECRGDYLFFVNNDTELTDGLIEGLLACFDRIPQLGCVSPKICYFPEPGQAQPTIQYAGTTAVNSFTARNRTIGAGEADRGQYDKAEATPYAHGAAMMVPREVLEQVGPMSEVFFLYYEELDWCERIRRAGYQIYVEPNTLIYHKESAAVGQDSPLKVEYLTRNRILFMRRNRSSAQVLIFSLFFLGITLPKWLLTYALRGRWAQLKAFWRGASWHLSSAPSKLKY
ncbi:MAG: glycosyltransferase family 2 protein [Bacteroidota bacterium]